MTDLTLAERITAIQARIATAAQRAGRDPAEITLVAVSKMHPAATVVAAYQAGLRVFGENRVEEARPKAAAVASLLDNLPSVPLRSAPGTIVVRRPSSTVEWHMIGHLQSRKADDVLPWASMVHSVDSVKLAGRLSRACLAADRELSILLEVNVAGEVNKYGLTPAELPAAVEAIAALSRVRLRGLMTMAPIVPDPEQARPVFAGLRRLRNDMALRFPMLDWRHLSMGMTDDFEIAIEEGATMVRIGRAIFGENG
jgi:pyridoxal phosphate enzyme (YggS family)